MAKKIDPLNRAKFGALSITLTVEDVRAAATFYQKAFGFKKRSLRNGPDGRPMHAELTLRGTTLMLGSEMEGWTQSAKALGGSPSTMYLYVENADKVFVKALRLGATERFPVTDMFWGDRCGSLNDPDGHAWSVATHIEEPTAREMARKMKAQMGS